MTQNYEENYEEENYEEEYEEEEYEEEEYDIEDVYEFANGFYGLI